MSIEYAPLKLPFSVNNFCKAADIGRTKFYQEVSECRLKTVKCGSKTLVKTNEAMRYPDNMKQTITAMVLGVLLLFASS